MTEINFLVLRCDLLLCLLSQFYLFSIFCGVSLCARQCSRCWELVVVVQSLSHVQLFVTPWTAACQASLSFAPGVCSNLCPLSRWCYLTISSSVVPFSSCPQSFPLLRSFPVSWLFSSSGQSIGASALTSVLPMNIQGWFPLDWL